MRTLHHPGPKLSKANANALMLAAHLSMRTSPSSRRYIVSFTPKGGAPRGLAECDPRHRAAVKRALEGGPLNGAREEWLDEQSGDKYVVREA